jgi:starvation-inducible outer membrane lipoprotein
MKKLLLVTGSFLIALNGCTQNWISDQSRAQADRNISFDVLTENASSYQGKFVMLGGTIISIKHRHDGTQFLVSEHMLDKWGRPDETIPSGGIFLATTSMHLEYMPGTLISMFGEVKGSETKLLNGVQYVCPIVSMRESHNIVEAPWRFYGYGGL